MEAKKPKSGGVKTFNCPSCGGTVTLRAVGISITAICQHCGSAIDVANEHFRIISTSKQKTRTILLPIGARGELSGIQWEVIGFMVRCDGTEMYFWREYLLFNPYHGFRFLVENQGHWSFVQLLRQNVGSKGTSGSVWFDGDEYRMFLNGRAKVEYVLGEFYWRVKVGDRTDVSDYVAPPFMLSLERNKQEITWSRGVYVEPAEIAMAFAHDVKTRFKQDFNLPPARGVAANQPSPLSGRGGSLMAACGIFIAALIGMQGLVSSLASDTLVYSQSFRTTGVDKGRTYASAPFVLSGGGNVLVGVSSPVENNWFELEMSLVNEQADESFNLLQGVEYYYGRDSDGAWAEGGRYSDTIISSVPDGTYRLVMTPDAGAYGLLAATVDYTVTVRRNVAAMSNFWVAFVLILAYPLLMAIRHWSFEQKRWSESDFAPAIFTTTE